MDNSPLTAQDRCDARGCGAQAQARTAHTVTPKPSKYPGVVPVEGQKPLLWCAHHLREHSNRLMVSLVWMTPEIAADKTLTSKY